MVTKRSEESQYFSWEISHTVLTLEAGPIRFLNTLSIVSCTKQEVYIIIFWTYDLHLSDMKQRKNPTPRSLAVLCLSTWTDTGRPIRSFIDTYIHTSCLAEKDRQLAVMLVRGVLRRQEYLDLIISRFSTVKLHKMKPLTLAALRVGVLQICLLDRIPDSAAVNETVAALKNMRQPGWLLGFVNATLRAVVRQKDSLPMPETAGPGGTPVQEHPAWLIRRWQKNFGKKTMEDICRINRMEPEAAPAINDIM